jgi:hypothetical protein
MADENKVYTAVGDIGTELRAKVDVFPGDVLFREPAFAFGCEDEDDDDSLPAIVQVAMNALEAEEDATSGRTFKHLTSDDDNDDDAQKNALFAWGADQILSRLTNHDLVMKTSKDDVVKAIRRVALNTFTVKSLMETEIALDDDDLDLVQCMMQIGTEDARGVGLYILASAANHSCAPNTFVTFDSNNEITFRATKPIKAHEAVTISYGPVVGVDGNVHQRREEILSSHCFHCQCASCVVETTTNMTTDSADDFEAMEFIEDVIVGGNYGASEALTKSMNAPENIAQSSMFGKAMTDTSIQSIAFDVVFALGFQKLALKSLELRCPRDHVAIAYEILRVCLLCVYDGEKNDGKEIERARRILSQHYGEDYAYKKTLDAFSRNSS